MKLLLISFKTSFISLESFFQSFKLYLLADTEALLSNDINISNQSLFIIAFSLGLSCKLSFTFIQTFCRGQVIAVDL